MSQIPYATPPQTPQYDLPAIAKFQKFVMFAILGYVAGIILAFVVPPSLAILPALVVFASAITGLVFVILLATKLFNTTTAVLYGIGAVIPVIGLIVLLVINGKATKVLKAAGYKVGLLGAKV